MRPTSPSLPGNPSLTTVLFIEDHLAIIEYGSQRLKAASPRLRLLTAATGAEGLALSRAHAPDVVLLDLSLPDGDGLEIVRCIAESHPQTPVAVITAYGSAENAVAALKAGAFDYLGKPVSLDQLRALVRSALKPIGAPYHSTAIDTSKDVIIHAEVEPATEEEIANTVTVMGGEDWELWMDALQAAGVGVINLAPMIQQSFGIDPSSPQARQAHETMILDALLGGLMIQPEQT